MPQQVGGAYEYLSLTNKYGSKRMRLSGQGLEALGGFYYKKRRPKKYSKDYSVGDILDILSVPNHPKVAVAAERWLNSVPDCDGSTLLDLLYLEQRLGCWAGPLAHGGTSAHRVFWPSAHRQTLEVMVGLPTHVKKAKDLHRLIIAREWPELLDIPFNSEWGIRGYLNKAESIAKKVTSKIYNIVN